MQEFRGEVNIYPNEDGNNFVVIISDEKGDIITTEVVSGIRIHVSGRLTPLFSPGRTEKKTREEKPKPVPINKIFMHREKTKAEAEKAVLDFVETLIRKNGPMSSRDIVRKIQEHNGYVAQTDISPVRMGFLLSKRFNRTVFSSHQKSAVWSVKE